MIKIKEANKGREYCNICNDLEKDKYYFIEFFNKQNQGTAVGLCENCLNDLTIKLLKNRGIKNDKSRSTR